MTDPERIRSYDDAAPDADETARAAFALGCFWGPDATFGALAGVVRTRVGYAGGEASQPTYHDVGDHSETVLAEYDPDGLGFDALLDVALANHDPRSQPRSRQYQHVLFYETDDQREQIETRLADLRVDSVATRVEPLDSFTAAEHYHQKYSLRNERALMAAFDEAGYDDDSFRDSPAAAKLNAHVVGKTVADIDELL